jgi:dsRNA-specific ribonuclease
MEHPNPHFKGFITSLLKLANLKESHIKTLTDSKCMIEFTRAFTSKKYNNTFNYEFYEILGDSTTNKVVVWYFSRRFPKMFVSGQGGVMGPVGIMARLKMEGISKKTYSEFSNQLGFWPFILCNQDEKLNKSSLLEDTFESFNGCLESLIDNLFNNHTGYSVVYEFMKSIMDKKIINLDMNSLYDSKTLLNLKMHKLNNEKYPDIRNKKKFDIKYVCIKGDVNNDIENVVNIFKCKATITDLIYHKTYVSNYGYGNTKELAEQNTAKWILDNNFIETIKNNSESEKPFVESKNSNFKDTNTDSDTEELP